jgi:RNA polymerase sigma-70 factor (ECF subfamily)
MADNDRDDRRTRFEQLALPHLRALYGSALRLTGDPESAADVVQEAYLRAFQTFDNFRPGTNARAWLFTILHTVAINRHKKRSREVGPLPVDELERRYQELLETAPPECADVEAWGASWPREIATALAGLPEEFRAAVLLVDVEDFSYEAAATALGCPLGTLQSRLHRGRRLLFAALNGYARQAGYLGPSTP